MQADGLADLAHGGGIAVLRGVLADEVEDLLLTLGQVHGCSSLLRSLDRTYVRDSRPTLGRMQGKPAAPGDPPAAV